jgi:hypothetical protein
MQRTMVALVRTLERDFFHVPPHFFVYSLRSLFNRFTAGYEASRLSAVLSRGENLT